MTVWHKMLSSCTHVATVGIKGLTRRRWFNIRCKLIDDVSKV